LRAETSRTIGDRGQVGLVGCHCHLRWLCFFFFFLTLNACITKQMPYMKERETSNYYGSYYLLRMRRWLGRQGVRQNYLLTTYIMFHIRTSAIVERTVPENMPTSPEVAKHDRTRARPLGTPYSSASRPAECFAACTRLIHAFRRHLQSPLL
jgi:hypothetical protein